MPDRRLQPTPAHSLTTLTGRFCYYLHYLFDDNQSRMASYVGLVPSKICKIANGQQRPSLESLERLAKHDKVNLVWLVTGQGSPWRSSSSPQS